MSDIEEIQNKLKTAITNIDYSEAEPVEDEFITPLSFNKKEQLISDLGCDINELNRNIVLNAKKDERKNIKLVCPSCAKLRFQKDFCTDLKKSQSMNFIKENHAGSTGVMSKFGVKMKIEIGTEYFYKCKYCQSNYCVIDEGEAQ